MVVFGNYSACCRLRVNTKYTTIFQLTDLVRGRLCGIRPEWCSCLPRQSAKIHLSLEEDIYISSKSQKTASPQTQNQGWFRFDSVTKLSLLGGCHHSCFWQFLFSLHRWRILCQVEFWAMDLLPEEKIPKNWNVYCHCGNCFSPI